MNFNGISVVIPCYNDSKYIIQAINSVLEQTSPVLEIIVVDDGSNEETKRVLNQNIGKISRLITQSNQGQSTARNNGIKHAKGDLIFVLDSDDYVDSTFCEKALEIMKLNDNIRIVSCEANFIMINKVFNIYKPKGGPLINFLLENCALGSVIFKKNDWEEAGGYDEQMNKGFEDWEYYIRLLKLGGEAHIINEPLLNYRVRTDSTTIRANKIKYDLRMYIFTKHMLIYKDHYTLFIGNLLEKIKKEETEKLEKVYSIEYQLGKKILIPMRKLKLIINKFKFFKYGK